MQTIAFIGMGNMAQALAQGFISSGRISKEQIYASAPHLEKLRKNAEKIGFVPALSNREAAEKADAVFIACKPYQIEAVLSELGSTLNGKMLVSIAAGWDYARFSKIVDPSVRIQTVMPNTPAMVGEGVLVFEETNSLEPEERKELMELFGTLGLVEELPSHLMGIAGAVTGCAPAFVDMMIEAYSDAAVKYGIARETSYRLISQMVLGAAKLQLETGEHPGVLKDRVCSPGGTTIVGVAALEQEGFRNACIRSIDAVMKRSNS